ncbi:MAG: hypothetical protein NVSMB12_05820 [Acidimicrobiales bacterium]
MTTRRATRGAVGLLLCSMLAAACSVGGITGPSTYAIQAPFPTTIGLYPGSFVRQLGIDVGSVTKVQNQGDHVLVSMKIDKHYHLAKDAHALLVGDSVLGERYVQFIPAYTGGPALPPGSVLTADHVQTPVETDTVLRSLNTVLRGINPADVKQFTLNLATLLDGQGTKLNDLIANAAGTVSLLANKSNDLGQLTTTLAQLSGQLRTRDQALASLIRDYDLLSGTLAADRSQIDGTITQLTNVTTSATGLLAPNLDPIKQDVAQLTTVGRTLDRNLSALDIGLTYTPRLFLAAQRAYDPQRNWLPLNTQSAPDKSTAILGGSIRDALSSLCRRLAAKNPASAPALAPCSNPASGFFDPVVGLLPTALQQISNPSPPKAPAVKPAGLTEAVPAAAPADATQAFAAGVAAIPGLSGEQRQALLGAPEASVSGAAPATTGSSPAPAGSALAATATSATASAPGSLAVASLAASPRGGVPARGSVRAASHGHHRNVFARFLHWLGRA